MMKLLRKIINCLNLLILNNLTNNKWNISYNNYLIYLKNISLIELKNHKYYLIHYLNKIILNFMISLMIKIKRNGNFYTNLNWTMLIFRLLA